MYPVTHALAACAVVKAGEPVLRRLAPASLARRPVDYRVAAVGGLLPDLVDKPLAWFLFPGVFDDTHLFGHTLLFSAVLIGFGVILARRGELRALVLGLGALTHLPLDPVIANASTLLWPAFGLEFDGRNLVSGAYMRLLDAALVGGLVMLVWRWERMRTILGGFVRRGELALTGNSDSGARRATVRRRPPVDRYHAKPLTLSCSHAPMPGSGRLCGALALSLTSLPRARDT